MAAGLETDPSWFPYDFDLAARTVAFTRASRAELAAPVFLDKVWDRSRLEQVSAPLNGFLAAEPQPSPAPLAIWHTSFCCSTLVANCLDLPGLCLPLKEPKALVDAAVAWLGQAPGADARFVRKVLAWLSRRFEPDERILIKPSNGANVLIPQLTDHVERHLLVYSSCEEFLCSIAGGGPASGGGEIRRRFARNLLGNRVLSRLTAPDWRPADLLGLSDLQVAALLWHVQVAEFRDAAAKRPDRFRSLDCAAFLARPGEALAALDGFFGLGLPGDAVDAILAGPRFRESAKEPGRSYDQAQRTASLQAARDQLGSSLDEVVRWSYDTFRLTPPGDPVGAALM